LRATGAFSYAYVDMNGDQVPLMISCLFLLKATDMCFQSLTVNNTVNGVNVANCIYRSSATSGFFDGYKSRFLPSTRRGHMLKEKQHLLCHRLICLVTQDFVKIEVKSISVQS
jgi:hypothetical protein